MNTLFLIMYFLAIYFIYNTTLGYIFLDRTIDPADKPELVKRLTFLYYGTLIAIYCQFTGLAMLR